ncbi:hypothetical protein F2Q68_00035037 [Brassica cretica]|uniref:Uncharacterized protein n=1 Tax=Brassica cretica TaxID=69181 RepID=A0A8S9H054_BRACR|nr:hypothetical protein F2Q68_00035037 [Brassica cretica]
MDETFLPRGRASSNARSLFCGTALILERLRELDRRGSRQREAETSPLFISGELNHRSLFSSSAYEGQPSSALPPGLLCCHSPFSDSSQALSPKLSLTIQGWMEKNEKRWPSDGED